MPWTWPQIKRYRRSLGPSVANKTLYGVNTFEPPYGATAHTANIAACTTIGAKVIRCGLTWSNTQTTSDPASINWTEWDSIYNKCLAANITPMFAIETTPAWANPSFGTPSIFAIPTYPSADFNSWVTLQAAWAAQVVTRYPLALFEWWNEWSSASGYWKEGDSGVAKPTIAAYAQAYMACYSAMKSAVPGCTVAVGGMTAVTYWSGPLATTAVNVVPLLLAISGFQTDAWSIHPYCHDFADPTPITDHFPTSNSFTDIARFQTVMKANGQGSKPLWVTEWGDYSAAAINGGETGKSQYVLTSLKMIRNKYGYGALGPNNAGVQIACIYPLQNAPSGAIQDSGLYAGTTSGVTTQLTAGAMFQFFTQTNGTYVAPVPPPVLTSATPNTEATGATSQNIALVGTGFVNGDSAIFSNVGVTVNSTTFNSSTSLTANVTVSGGATPGAGTVLVRNATTGDSNTVAFTVTSGVPVNPDTAGLVLQLLASAGTSTTTNGAGLSSWTDQSATGAVFNQATGGLQPTYVTSGQNSLPAIAFSGSQYLVAAATVSAINISLLKFFAVIKVTGGTSTARAIFSNYNPTGNLGWEILADANDSWRLAYGNGSSTDVTAGGTVNTTAHVITGWFQSTGTLTAIRIDGTQVASDAHTIVTQTTLAPAIGTASNNVGLEKFVGQISEMLLYNPAIHDPTPGTIEAYLKSKYNTP